MNVAQQYREAAVQELLRKIKAKPAAAAAAIKDGLHKRDDCFHQAWILYKMELPDDDKDPDT